MDFGEKLIRLRRAGGYSQEQLADYLNVSRQSVSKWESGQAMPELHKLIQISDLFSVTLDDLARDERALPDKTAGWEEADSRREDSQDARELEELRKEVKELSASLGGYKHAEYEYKSKITVGSIPLVHVHLSLNPIRLGRYGSPVRVAKGIVAVGDMAVGVLSFGAVSIGVLPIGAVSLGIVSAGAVAVGAAAFGCVAIGILAVGVSAVGVYSAGVAAAGLKAAVGVSAAGKVAVGIQEAKGQFTLIAAGHSREYVREFIMEHLPGTWPVIARFLSWFVR